MIKAVIFDFDGVLVESVDLKTEAFRKLFKPEGRIIADKVVDYHLRNTGVSRFNKFKYIYKNILKRKLTKPTFNCLCDRFSNLVMEEVVRAPYVKGAKEFLDKYAGKYKFFISSATPQKEIEYIIYKRGMNKYFKKIYGSPNTKVNIVKKILRCGKLKPCEVVYVGDSLSDYKAAKSQGAGFIARIKNNKGIFKDVRCIKIMNLVNLYSATEKLS